MLQDHSIINVFKADKDQKNNKRLKIYRYIGSLKAIH